MNININFDKFGRLKSTEFRWGFNIRKTFFLIILFYFFICSLPCIADHKHYLSICAIFQDEAPYLKEWIEFHKLVGVDHFYLYNNNSKDGFREVLKPYIEDGTVDLEDDLTVANSILTFYPMQYKCYTRCLDHARGKSKWVAFLDIDEFLFPIQEQMLPTVLKKYEKFGGVRVNWLIFGTSDVKKIPDDKLMIETLTRCSEKNYVDNRFIKSIVRPECASHFESAHDPMYLEGYSGVNTDKLPGEGYYSDYIKTDKLRINHYWSRDEHFFYNVKVPRHKVWGGKPSIEIINKHMNLQKDEVILKYVPDLRRALFKK